MRSAIIGASLLLSTLAMGIGTNVNAESTIQGLTVTENATELLESKTHNRCEEDMPCWNCETMGNKICGTLPRTN